MYLLVDLDNMVVRYKHANQTVLADLMFLEFPHCTAIVMPDDMESVYNTFSDLQLKQLYLNTTGQKLESYIKGKIIHDTMLVCQALPETPLNVLEIATQAASVDRYDDRLFKYAPGKSTPEVVEEPFEKQALQAPQGFTPAPYIPPPVTAAPAHVAHVAALPARTAHAPAAPTSNTAPKSGSKTGRVWEIADSLYTPGATPKSLRKQIIEACEAEGINGSTASVQFGKWSKTKL